MPIFCGEEFFQHRLVFDRSSLTRWRNRMGEERLKDQGEPVDCGQEPGDHAFGAFPDDVDTAVQLKKVIFPTAAKLLNRAREKLVRLAKLAGLDLRQSYARVG